MIELAKAVVDLAVAYLKPRLATVGRTDKEIRVGIERHLSDVAAWSTRHQFYGMSKPEETSDTTIALRLATQPRRFRRRDESSTTHSEVDLLSTPDHYLLLGDPGAGKTTTLKRLAARILFEQPADQADTLQFPVVIRLREIEPGESLLRKLAKELSIPYSDRPSYASGMEPRPNEYYVDRERLDDFIASFFNSSSTLLLLDGLDEVERTVRPAVNHDLLWLARNLNAGKLIVSCRTGDFTTNLEGLSLLEICPLSPDEIRQIAQVWLSNPGEFLSALSALPYSDLLDRPLMLTQLLFIFKRFGYLPDQPSQIYRKAVALLLYKWDTEREVPRRSRYALFDLERKAEFLAAVAYYLTYRAKAKLFSSELLAEVYSHLYDRFGLPQSEMQQVVSEIETHTGIISVAGYDMYEFSHLSLQEYLCAEYIVREPFAEHLTHYFGEFPSPIAIAVTLSSNPSTWLAAVVLRAQTAHGPQPMKAFLLRLLAEHPMFAPSAELGAAVMKLFYTWSEYGEILEILGGLLELANVTPSVALALPLFRIMTPERATQGFVELRPARQLPNPAEFPMPEVAYLPTALFNALNSRE